MACMLRVVRKSLIATALFFLLAGGIWIVKQKSKGTKATDATSSQTDALGFGHEVALNYTDTTGDVDASTGKANINKRTDMTDSGFASDGGTRLVVLTRADGSRTLLLVTSTLIDATGRPVSDRE